MSGPRQAGAPTATVPLDRPVRGRRAVPVTIPRERILHIAARLFRQRGYQGTTVRDIGEAVGILSGSLFYHFRSKDEMLLEIMRETALSHCLQAEAVLGRTDDPDERLRQLIDIELAWIIGDIKQDHLAVLVFEWREVPEFARPELTRLRHRYDGICLDVLEQSSLFVTMRIPAAAARILHGARMGAMTWFRRPGRYSARESGDMLFNLLQA